MKSRSPFARREAPAYRITAGPSSQTAEIQLYDEIGYFGVTANDFVRDLKAIQADTIHLRINSPGGSVFDGLAIANALKAHPAHVVVHIDGLAASIASIIALAGDEVRIAPTAFFMIHNAWTFAIGDAKELRKTADTLEKIGGSLVDTYIDATGEPKSRIVAWMDEETWFNADEAVEHGFATAIDEDDAEEEATAAAARFDLSVFQKAPPALTQRLAAKATPTKRTIERALRDAGLSRSDAKAATASALATLAQRDAATDGAVAPPLVPDAATVAAAVAKLNAIISPLT